MSLIYNWRSEISEWTVTWKSYFYRKLLIENIFIRLVVKYNMSRFKRRVRTRFSNTSSLIGALDFKHSVFIGRHTHTLMWPYSGEKTLLKRATPRGSRNRRALRVLPKMKEANEIFNYYSIAICIIYQSLINRLKLCSTHVKSGIKTRTFVIFKGLIFDNQ